MGDLLFSGSRDMCVKKWNLAEQKLEQVSELNVNKLGFQSKPKSNWSSTCLTRCVCEDCPTGARQYFEFGTKLSRLAVCCIWRQCLVSVLVNKWCAQGLDHRVVLHAWRQRVAKRMPGRYSQTVEHWRLLVARRTSCAQHSDQRHSNQWTAHLHCQQVRTNKPVYHICDKRNNNHPCNIYIISW